MIQVPQGINACVQEYPTGHQISEDIIFTGNAPDWAQQLQTGNYLHDGSSSAHFARYSGYTEKVKGLCFQIIGMKIQNQFY